MTSNQLNAGAASFTPGGPPAAVAQDDSFSAYIDFVEDIHEAMDDEDLDETFVPPRPADAGVSGLPEHLAKHASEFWFPESRDCTCCNGFKHGCRCAASHGGVCDSCNPGGGSGGPPAGSLPPAGQAGGRGQQICKFFRSPQGCRFGSGCRFLHS
jgi:hypothetical protein